MKFITNNEQSLYTFLLSSRPIRLRATAYLAIVLDDACSVVMIVLSLVLINIYNNVPK